MNILFSVHRYHPNHDGMVIGLRAAGHRVSFLVHRTFPTERYVEGVEVHLLQRSALARLIPGTGSDSEIARFRTLPSLATLRLVLAQIRPDVVVARDATLANYLLFLLCRLRGIAYLLYVQNRTGYEKELSAGLKGRAARLLLRLGLWPRHTINTTKYRPAAPVAGKTFDFIPFAIEPYGPGKESYPTALPLRLLAVGKLDHPDKHNPELVHTLAPDLRAGRVRLTIAGLRIAEVTPTYRRLLAAIDAAGVGEAVTLIENLTYDETRALYREHDLFVMPNTRETAGIAPVEAMASGLPAIITSDTGTSYFAEPGETGFVFRDCDFENLRARVTYFLDAPSEVERMGRRARQVIRERYSPADFAERFADILARRYPGRSGVLRATSVTSPAP